MPTTNPRVMLTLPVELDNTFKRLAELEGKPKTKVIVDYLASIQPHAQTMINAFEALKEKKANPVDILQTLTQEMLIAVGQMGLEMRDTIQAAKAKGDANGNDD